MDGLNVHFAGVDEVHEHPNPEIIQKLNTATGARRQPLLSAILPMSSEAGIARQCWFVSPQHPQPYRYQYIYSQSNLAPLLAADASS